MSGKFSLSVGEGSEQRISVFFLGSRSHYASMFITSRTDKPMNRWFYKANFFQNAIGEFFYSRQQRESGVTPKQRQEKKRRMPSFH